MSPEAPVVVALTSLKPAVGARTSVPSAVLMVTPPVPVEVPRRPSPPVANTLPVTRSILARPLTAEACTPLPAVEVTLPPTVARMP